MSDAAPDRRPTRRWLPPPYLRFSLRLLLVVITVLCLWLGMMVKDARRQARHLAAIERLGGSVEYAHQFADGYWQLGRRDVYAPVPGAKWLRGIVGDEFFVQPVAVRFRRVPIDDDDLVHVAGLPDLEYLSLVRNEEDTGIRGVGLAHLKNAKKLRHLELVGHPVGDASLQELRHLTNLEVLDLRDTRTTDAGLAHLTRLPKLRQIALDGTQVTDAGILQLVSMPNLKVILVRDTQVTGEGAAAFEQRRPDCRVRLWFIPNSDPTRGPAA